MMWKVVLLFIVFCGAYCGTIKDVSLSASEIIRIFSTTKQVPEFTLRNSTFGATKVASAIQAIVNPKLKYQKIIGFGGTFSDASGINLNKLPEDIRKQVLEALFGNSGIGMNLCRVPIGVTEFSTRLYTLDDHDGDTTLKQFALENEDLVDKIPIIKEATSLRNDLKLFASASTAPLWMKDHKVWTGYSMLNEKYGQVYAEYLKKFLDEYKKQGINWWGITTGNNPTNGFRRNEPNSMGWVPDLQSKWIREHFGPIIRNSSHKSIKILGHDDTSLTFPYFAPVYTEDKETLKYLDGLATHWNLRSNLHPSIRDFAKNDQKELFLLETETSYGNVNPVVGNWDKAFNIIGQMFTRLQWDYVGWVDASLVLDSNGGPSYVNLHSDAPILLGKDGKSFTKTPTYYALGHFSKFVIPGSVRIAVDLAPNKNYLQSVAFLRPDNVKVISIYNSNAITVAIQINDGGNYSHPISIPGQSLHTILY